MGRPETEGQGTWRGGFDQASDSYGHDAGNCDGFGYDAGTDVLIKGNRAPSDIEAGRMRKEKGGEKMGDIRESIQLFWIEEDAVGVVELILILVVLIALVAIFKSQLLSLVKTLLSTVTSKSTEITK
jgi:hypothetical protein